jgi:hypothetical protein
VPRRFELRSTAPHPAGSPGRGAADERRADGVLAAAPRTALSPPESIQGLDREERLGGAERSRQAGLALLRDAQGLAARTSAVRATEHHAQRRRRQSRSSSGLAGACGLGVCAVVQQDGGSRARERPGGSAGPCPHGRVSAPTTGGTSSCPTYDPAAEARHPVSSSSHPRTSSKRFSRRNAHCLAVQQR